jgi:catechol 2,3-dioxygenase-like lactoylglutathione lyase family enzyme
VINKLLRITLIVRDQEEAFRFYTEKLGFEKRADQPMGENTRWLTIASKGIHDLEIVLQPLDWFKGKEREEHAALVGKNPTMVFLVDDCKKTYDLLRERGVKFEQSPQERPYGLEVLAKDLYSNTLD